jgi:protein-arginine kinase activator protein McsA
MQLCDSAFASSAEKLKNELDEAIACENYERAAEIRDKLKELSQKSD